jgi:penicillin-binding protein 1A
VSLRGVLVVLICLAAVVGLSSCSGIGSRGGSLSVDAPELYGKLSQALEAKNTIKPSQSLVIYSSDGVELGRALGDNRTYVELKDIPKNLRRATVAIEDSRFYSHSGVDPRGIARAIWRDVKAGRLAEGGSTITQQLVRNVCLSNRKTFERKVDELVLAIKVERKLSKEEILELYLNQIYYGRGAYGVEAASQAYFGKPVSELDLPESALIAGLPKAPSSYAGDPGKALKRRDIVLNRMAELKYITAKDRDRAKRERLAIAPKADGPNGQRAPHFVAYVLSQLRSRYSDDTLSGGGLKVYTTLDYRMQRIAERALRTGIRRSSRALHVKEGCFVCIDPATGYVRAMVGSVDPKSEFNRCTQGHGRQPGSAFKPFVYAAAVEAGMKPSDKILDEPVSYGGVGGKAWTPGNYDDRFHGMVTLEQAFARSINIPAIKLADKVGISNVIRIAHASGIESELEPYLTTAIGGVKGVHPVEMASAYGTFANGGVHVEPISILRVTDWRGGNVHEFTTDASRAISPEVCSTMDYLLRQVVVDPAGTGHRVNDVPQARGKTGTTNDDRDAWFVGYVPGKLVAAVWAGNDDNSPMRHVFGGSVCAPIWRQFMLKAIRLHGKGAHPAAPLVQEPKNDSEKQPAEAKPDDVTVTEQKDLVTCTICDESGLLSGKLCLHTHEEQFVRGTEPTQICTAHNTTEPAPPDRLPRPLPPR